MTPCTLFRVQRAQGPDTCHAEPGWWQGERLSIPVCFPSELIVTSTPGGKGCSKRLERGTPELVLSALQMRPARYVCIWRTTKPTHVQPTPAPVNWMMILLNRAGSRTRLSGHTLPGLSPQSQRREPTLSRSLQLFPTCSLDAFTASRAA